MKNSIAVAQHRARQPKRGPWSLHGNKELLWQEAEVAGSKIIQIQYKVGPVTSSKWDYSSTYSGYNPSYPVPVYNAISRGFNSI